MTITFQTSAFDSESNPVIHHKLAEWLHKGGYSSWRLYNGTAAIELVPGVTIESMLEEIQNRFSPPPNANWLYTDTNTNLNGEHTAFATNVLVCPKFSLSVSYRHPSDVERLSSHYSISLNWHNVLPEESVNDLKRYISSCFVKAPAPTTKGYVYMLMASSGDYQFKQLPQPIMSSLEEGNYDPQVLTAFNRVAEDLGAKTPTGRISIFDGPPGTGKTYLIRGLMSECDKVAFVFVAPEQIVQLTGPNFLGQLIDFSKRVQKPVAFIVEDADDVIANRNSGNMSYVSNILNLGDGILGQMLDLRLIFTTNAKSTDLDPAIVRPGRLSAHIHVGPLSADQCNAIFKRLTGKAGDFVNKSYTLAEVYQQAINTGWNASPTVKPQKRIGFGLDID